MKCIHTSILTTFFVKSRLSRIMGKSCLSEFSGLFWIFFRQQLVWHKPTPSPAPQYGRVVTVPQKPRNDTLCHQSSHYNDPSPVSLSCLILLSILKNRDLRGNRHMGIDGKWCWLFTCPLTDTTSKLTMPWQAPYPLQKARSNHSWKQCGSETFLPSSS